jgi:hypothetical protein
LPEGVHLQKLLFSSEPEVTGDNEIAFEPGNKVTESHLNLQRVVMLPPLHHFSLKGDFGNAGSQKGVSYAV